MEHISVPVSVTRICASVALLTVTKRAPHRGAARTFSCNLRGERWHERARSSNACARSIANVVCASRAAPTHACASARRSYQHARRAANGACATRALAAHNHSGVSARMDNDSPTLRITGRPKKLEHISVLICVTRICVSATLRFHDVAPACERSALASATPRPNARASCDGGRVSQLHP